jgi:DNA-binding CsgD family transcriptional regulator
MGLMHKSWYTHRLTDSQTAAYILRCISDGKNEEQIAERFDGDKELVKMWLDTLKMFIS